MSARKPSELAIADQQDLLIRAQASANGFGELFDQCYDRVYAYAYRRVGTRMAAEDIAACVFEDALKSIQRVHWQGKPVIAWLYRIASRRVADYYRDRQNSVVGEKDWAAHEEVGPDARLERTEMFAQVQSGLDRLPVKDREIIQLTYFDQATANEIAAMWDCTPNTVYVRLHRALKRLKTELEDQSHEMG